MTNDQAMTLSLLGYNTHLFGDALPQEFLDFLRQEGLPIPILRDDDPERAEQIAKHVKNSGADFVGLAEVWDDALAQLILNRVDAVYPHSYRPERDDLDFPERTFPYLLGCGLLILSKYPLIGKDLYPSGEEFYLYNDLASVDQFSHKGIAVAMVEIEVGRKQVKLVLMLTHTQAGYGDDKYIDIQKSNIAQLEWTIEDYQKGNQVALVFAFGDFNVNAENEQGQPTEEYTCMIDLFHESQLTDSFRTRYPDAKQNPGYTSDALTNRLIPIFSPGDSSRQRNDYIFYSSKDSDALTVVPIESKVLNAGYTYVDDKGLEMDLSDHYPLWGGFSLSIEE